MKKEKDSNKHNALRAAVFLCLIAAILLGFNHFLGFAGADRTNTVLKQFYDQEPGTVDNIYFGSSVTQRGFVSPEAYHEYGIASYSIATGDQPFILTRYLMEETQKTQDPELFIVDLKHICRGKDRIDDAAVRKVIDNMKPSATKFRAVKALTEYAEGGDNEIDTSGLSYYFPLFKYHSRWNPDLQPDYWDDLYYFKGYTLAAGVCFDVEDIKIPEYDEDIRIPLDPENEEVLKDLLDYCDSIDAKVLFVVAPYQGTEDGMGKFNYATDIIEDRGYEVLNFLKEDLRRDAGIDDRCCFHNKAHLNYYGSLQYTAYLSQYIRDNYGVSDRRGDGKHDDWEDSYRLLQKTIKDGYYDSYREMYDKIDKILSGEQ